MSDPSELAARLAANHVVVSDPETLVTATVDGAAQLVDLIFDPRVMRLESAAAAGLVLETVQRAQQAAQEQLSEVIAGGPTTTEQAQSQAELGVLQQAAQQRLAEMSATLDELADRLEHRD